MMEEDEEEPAGVSEFSFEVFDTEKGTHDTRRTPEHQNISSSTVCQRHVTERRRQRGHLINN